VRSTLGDLGRLLQAALDPKSPLADVFAKIERPEASAHPFEGDFTSLAGIVWPREGLFWKDGQVSGYRCVIALLPEARKGFFVVVNSERVDIEALGMALVDALLDPNTAIDAANHPDFVVGTVPNDAQRADVRFGESIRLEGWQAPERVVAGESAKVTFFYRCLAPVRRDWRMFVHGDAVVPATAARIHLDHFPGGDHDSTAYWRAGEIVRDAFEVPVPRDFDASAFDLWVGFYRGNVRMTASGQANSVLANRARGPHILVEHAAR
jgi:hypothetical protein